MLTMKPALGGIQALIPPDWQARSCTNEACASDTWVVKRAPMLAQLWWVAPQPNQGLALVAGRDPLCPRCGSPLSAMPAPRGEAQPLAMPRMRRR